MDRKLNIVEMSVPLNLIYRLNVILIKIPTNYFVDIDKMILQCTRRSKTLRIANIVLKNKVGRLTLPYIKTNYKDTIINIEWCW